MLRGRLAHAPPTAHWRAVVRAAAFARAVLARAMRDAHGGPSSGVLRGGTRVRDGGRSSGARGRCDDRLRAAGQAERREKSCRELSHPMTVGLLSPGLEHLTRSGRMYEKPRVGGRFVQTAERAHARARTKLHPPPTDVDHAATSKPTAATRPRKHTLAADTPAATPREQAQRSRTAPTNVPNAPSRLHPATRCSTAPRQRTRRDRAVAQDAPPRRPGTADLAEWRMASGRPDTDALMFPGQSGAA